MSDIAIRVENVGKRFELGELGTASDFYRKTRSLARRLLRPSRNGHGDPDKPWEHETDPTAFWALKGIDFEVKEGEVLGIIGANGAGKSTLLKVLSRITAPTVGHIELYGRVASLLEVGTGFHPELTGRENVYLNGSILGMSRAEITAKLDAIVDFAGVEKFIDTPVKRYSSGMRVRLGFAVAAHLEPEILIVDEVLAVGDAAFQAKCLGKMQEVASGGRTVLFVSHNMPSIERLCQRAILIENGRLALDEDSATTVSVYLSRDILLDADVDLSTRRSPAASGHCVLRQLRTLNAEGEPTSAFPMGERITFALRVAPRERMVNPRVGIGIDNANGQRIFTLHTLYSRNSIAEIEQECWVLCSIPSLNLMPGVYSIKVAVGEGLRDIDVVDKAASFEVIPSDVTGTGQIPSVSQGVMYQQCEWECQPRLERSCMVAGE